MGCGSSQKGGDQNTKEQVMTDQEKTRLEGTASHAVIRRFYVFLRVLGSGGFGIVQLAYHKTNPDKKVAIQIIDKSKVKDKHYMLLRELEILQTLDHPNIVKFYEVYQDAMYFYICQEYAGGGELLERITKKKVFTEKEAAFILKKLLSAVNHMHRRKVVHRDLKPENILFSGQQSDAEIKIIDFGLSNQFNLNIALHTQVGTPIYVSPEVLQGVYNESCDIWSLGVILYVLLCGYPPFFGQNRGEIFYEIENTDPDLKSQDWRKVTQNAKDLITKLLIKNPKKRLTAEQALQHPWFEILKTENKQKYLSSQNIPGSTSDVDPNIMNMLQNFRTPTKFQKEVMKVIINQLNEKDITSLKKAFETLDKENTGLLKVEQVEEAMTQCGFQTTKEEIDQLIQNVHLDSENAEENYIKYTDFIAATLDQKQYLTQEQMWSLFKYFDQNNAGFIYISDLQEIMARHGQKVNEESLMIIQNEIDPEKQGQINFEEFSQMVYQQEEIANSLDIAAAK